MIRWLLIALFIYMIWKLIRGPKPKKRPRNQNPFSTGRNGAGPRRKGRKPDFDRIEEAEFEDITEKEKKSDQNK
ncbi:MAG: hypothetical protein JJU46_04390 [Balneolaceae bacterium]|nr:hypothetical protein [Balneolaceae bacterium]MCH8549331.1 hypothetical protein [Balneolaceae bacterium]